MSDDLERLLGQLRPRGAPGELRPRVLDAVEHERLTLKETPTMFKSKLMYAAITLFVLLATVVTADGGWMWASGGRLETKLKAIRDAGDPVTLPDLAKPNLAPDDNAAVSVKRGQKAIAPIVAELNKIGNGKDPAAPLAEEDRKKMKAAMDANPEVFTLLEKAAGRSTYHAPLDFTAAPDAVTKEAMDDGTEFRGIIALLDARSKVQLADGKRDEALQTCLLLFRLTRLYGSNLFMVNSFVTCAGRAVAVEAANRVLRSGPVADADRDQLETELAKHDDHKTFIQALKNERAFGVSSFASMKNLLNAAFLNDDECFYLDLVQEQIDIAPKPYAEFQKSVKNFQATAGMTTPLANLFFPALQKVREADERTRGVVRCLRVLNALQRAGVKPEDGEPKLSALKLPAAATTDPFTDKPLGVKVVDGQFVIYTVGPDLRDDGGDLANHKDFGVGPLPAEGKK